MKVLGLIVEYNPFHNGHLYHIEQSKKLTGADYTVCVMSGNFIQRGEPAMINKWARTKMALMSGVDLVIELPLVYAMSSAEFFAYGAVKILDSLGIVDCISFGSEIGTIHVLDQIAEILKNEPEEFKSRLKNELAKGVSFPAAREAALKGYFKDMNLDGEGIEDVLGSSNNILGIEYLKALKSIRSSIEPYTIKRVSNAYNTKEITGSISSATAIRKHIFNVDESAEYLEKLEEVLPNASRRVLCEEFTEGRGPIFAQHFESMILAGVRRLSAEGLRELPYMNEGIEHRIKKAGDISGSFIELIEQISTKRYTKTRIQRTLFNLLTSITADEFNKFNRYGGPQYIKVLGFNLKGRQMLSLINKRAALPVITKAADYKRSCNRLLTRMLEIENFSTDMYVLAYSNKDCRKAGQEYTQSPIRFQL